MNQPETNWFELLCKYTDSRIDNHFNGEYVDIRFDYLWLDDPQDKNRKINCGPLIHQIPGWRQKVVVDTWIKTYETLSWDFESIKKPGNAYETYRMTINKRDIKLNELV